MILGTRDKDNLPPFANRVISLDNQMNSNERKEFAPVGVFQTINVGEDLLSAFRSHEQIIAITKPDVLRISEFDA